MLTVDSPGLTDAAGQVETSASVLAGLDVAGPFSTVSDALVGSRTSQSCLWVSTRLGAAVQVYSEGLQALAGAARTSAGDFAGTDQGGDGDGPALPVDADAGDPTPPEAVLERLGAAFLRADVVVRRPGGRAAVRP